MITETARFVDGPRLLADVGGTNARFAIETAPRQFEAVAVLPCSGYSSLGAAAACYLGAVGEHAAGIRHAAIAIANPVDGDSVKMTNHSWSFSTAALREELDLSTLLVVNDFTALAMALPHLRPSQRTRIGGGVELPGRTIGLIGPGTGLGVSGIVPVDGRWAPLASEGGHASFAPGDDTEIAIMQALWRQYGHASAERLLSGPGLELIYRVLSGQEKSAALITEQALAGMDAACVRTVDCFCAVLGSVAGSVALTLGATGGMYIGGGIVPRLGHLFAQSPFRARFEAKGRLQPYLERIPTFLITEQYPAFLGVSAILSEQPVHRH
ncbi:glucokinase [Massilia sp. PAMC28688]|uniref:glucokinase n=1 Tax=Massilia sp. PAMC28688 TaxID=2861283 RepID=UPI001C62EE3C|nr:glucokinase [Massilia sp. PAMC28688]QYF94705.1 glucokinase [Massilia sp. PAMC28688]